MKKKIKVNGLIYFVYVLAFLLLSEITLWIFGNDTMTDLIYSFVIMVLYFVLGCLYFIHASKKKA